MEQLIRRRAVVAERWGLTDEVVLVRAGEPLSMDGSDQFYPFWPHPEHRYLAGSATPGAVLAFDAAERSWDLFAPRLSADELVWEAEPPPVGRPLGELDGWLAQRKGRQVLHAGAGGDPALAQVIGEVRLHKDEAELESLRAANRASKVGYDWLFAETRAGLSERDLQIGMEAGFFRGGADRVAYESIVAGGPNGAVLHFLPTARVLQAGDLLLVDAGGSVDGYASDITRTVVVGAEPTEVQRFLWELVLRTQELAIDRCRPGVEWREVHLEAARHIGAGLVELGLLRGEVDELVSAGAVALFFPHGLGHLIGLTVHDAAGYPPGRERSSHPQLRYLRTDRPLEAGMITSVEPGVYFIEALLGDEALRARHRDHVDWARVDELRGFGGIRIEDDIHVTDGEPEVLTAAVPKPLRVG